MKTAEELLDAVFAPVQELGSNPTPTTTMAAYQRSINILKQELKLQYEKGWSDKAKEINDLHKKNQQRQN